MRSTINNAYVMYRHLLCRNRIFLGLFGVQRFSAPRARRF